MSESGRNRELELLTELCRELIKFRFQVGMSDARPAVFIRDASGGVSWIIALDESGEHFELHHRERRYLVTDTAGAGAAIAAEVWKHAGMSALRP
ncbi:hypothetical protein NE236_05825 [Actinoallomurus purpureus]|uniref:hypothetical protein n=1 Tax=Actinoallomurus purpureus TaxID=478114 RepID=UPI002092B36C|nr:hypothetical protein [Actinoallomurus purpureus]MCO6004494.1 hypothetical protein [Actinoallomurus purpureus]